MSEVEKLRGLLEEARTHIASSCRAHARRLLNAIEATLAEPQGEPATANQCDGCRAGMPVDENGNHRMGKPVGYADLMRCQAARYVSEPAPAQDEREAFEQIYRAQCEANGNPNLPKLRWLDQGVMPRYEDRDEQLLWEGWQARATRPAQTEQQPVEVMRFQYRHPDKGETHTVSLSRKEVADRLDDELFEKLTEAFCSCEPIGETTVVECRCDEYAEEFELVNAAPIAQTAPQPEQSGLVMPVALSSVNEQYDKGWNDHAAEVARLNTPAQRGDA